jgi:hypothetical protein
MLDSDDIDPAACEGDGDRAETSANLKDELPRSEVSLGNDSLSVFGTKEVLTETATALVPLCPHVRGHGRSRP